ncbi:hypothetical protein CONPUDRAFT_90067 [Coniophora puteana RWD-64-598 SS2]|uniref:Uncharacterized protein n=1 Tax=Coniophora puteana (strain RWD-64-598) TaxID=741705 RepID=A0A5M3MQJ6_CONPW|nr:uncharacterized protein CONPUDRAFT_90067 [Coniophora puteana RWD-64-598 SS2]EIW81004.1 hypothetical protein CONPUDRAFT_90067 [Coniophora puteana RWD-64-598 SS2]
MRDQQCIYGHLITQENVDIFRQQDVFQAKIDIIDGSFCKDPSSVAATAYCWQGPFIGRTKTVVDDDKQLVTCLIYIYVSKGIVADVRLPSAITEKIEKSLGIQDSKPRWYLVHKKTPAQRMADLLAQYEVRILILCASSSTNDVSKTRYASIAGIL